MTTWTALGIAFGLFLAWRGGRWYLKQKEFLDFLTDATATLEGMAAEAKLDMAGFEARWAEDWDRPDFEMAMAHFEAPPGPAVRALYAEATGRAIQDAALAGTPWTIGNFFPLAYCRTSVAAMEAGEVAFAQDRAGDLFVTPWAADGPVWWVPYGGDGEAAPPRAEVAPSLAAFLAMPRTPLPPKR